MLLNFAIALIFIAAVFTATRVIKCRLLTPVMSRNSTKIKLTVNISGNDASLEHTLRSLVWLHENGTLKADIVLNIATDDSTTCRIAEIYAEKYSYIYCSFGDGSWKNFQN